MKTVAGLDLSLNSSGWSCNGLQTVVQPKSVGVERLFEISEALEKLLKENDSPAVVVEGYSFASKNSQAHSIGELGGVVRMLLYRRSIPFVVIPPTVRAKFATGKGNASKSEVVSTISAKTGIIWEGKGADDKCDAFILEECGLAALGRQRHEWSKQQYEVLEKFDWEPLRRYCDENYSD